MINLGEMTAEGFMPNSPEVGDIFKSLGIKGGVQELLSGTAGKHLIENTATTKLQELKRDYARVFNDPAGRRVIEDLMNQTTRRARKPAGGFKSIEETALYGAERHGQEAIVIYALAMIKQGLALPAPQTAKKKKK